MIANGNWGEVTASQGGARLEPGGYACRVLMVEDGSAEANPYIGLVLEPLSPTPGADGRRRPLYRVDLNDREGLWRHTYRFFIGAYGGGGIDWGRYKALVEAVEKTAQNGGFQYQDVEGGEQQLVGKWVGVVFRSRKYIGQRGAHKGEVRTTIEIGGVCPADDALAGEFPAQWAEERDQTGGSSAPVPPPPAPAPMPVAKAVAPAPAPAPPDVADEDIPF